MRNAECENALTLAINLMLLPMGATLIANAGMSSRDGRCKFLDARANGYARAEGVGGVLISPERELLADMQGTAGLRGSAVRSDGKSASLTAPNGEAQVALLRAAVLDGQFDVWSISTVECHGTGTALGDPIETSAQRGALSTDDGMNEVLSGIKANVGHMEPAAAMVGLLRLSTALQNTAIAPNGQLHSLNEHVHHALRGVSCVLPAQCVVLGRAIKRMGGLSSFGYAGTIAHAVLRHDVGLVGISAIVSQWDLPASERTDKGPCIPLFVRRSLAWGPITRVPASYPHSTALLASRRITRVLDATLAQLAPSLYRGDPFRMPPSDLVVVGCGITGLTSASLFSKEGADVIMIEKSSRVGGVWSHYANPYSRVQTSEPAYRLQTDRGRTNMNHTPQHMILHDLLFMIRQYGLSPCIHLDTTAIAVRQISNAGQAEAGIQVMTLAKRQRHTFLGRWAIVATNRRLGKPRQITYEGELRFAGDIRRGLGGDISDVSWGRKAVAIVGMGA